MRNVTRQTRKRKLNPLKESLSWSKTKRKAEFQPELETSSGALHAAEKSAVSPLAKAKSQEIIPHVSSSKRSLPRLQYYSEAQIKEPVNTAGSVEHIGGQGQFQFSPPQCAVLPEGDSDQGLVITWDDEMPEGQRAARRKGSTKRRRDEIGEAVMPCLDQEDMIEVEIDQQLDQELENKSRQHNLTTVNVRNIIHEVITNEHVVAMMKAAITETEAMPVFEPKMTRSKLKEVVEKGVVIPTWNISPIKKPSTEKPPQFVDIPLEEEDSSDDEYCPDEDEEDETTEETLLESDMESTASSPRGSRVSLPRALIEYDEERSSSPSQGVHKSRHVQVDVLPMGPPPPPQSWGFLRPPAAPSECSFMEKLHAVEEELATGSICMEPYQALGGGGHGDDLMAFRTRSKRPLRDVPLGQLEAELRAPDITPDMYECGSGPEDREWAEWLQGLMASDMENEEEGDDDDDPEYNFLEDIDEPDVEDYRNDRAVRITKKEVNELMEELFDTFHDDPGVQEEGHEEEEKEDVVLQKEAPEFNIPQSIQFEEPLACILTERHRTVREQLEALRKHQALFGKQAPPPPAPAPPCILTLNAVQRQQLQQQVQQHIQLLTQVFMLTHSVTSLQSEANTSHLLLTELQTFAHHSEEARGVVDPPFSSIFRACNLQGALSLLEELRDSSTPHDTGQLQAACSTSAGRSNPLLPSHLAWLLATRPVFLYPELLPHCSLVPQLHPPRSNTIYTRGEESLVVLGLRNFRETENPYQLICQYLVCAKKPKQLRRHVHDMCRRNAPASPIKFYCEHQQVPPLPLACRKVMPEEQCPPIEREETVLPTWLRKSLPYIHKAIEEYNCPPDGDLPSKSQTKGSPTLGHGTCYPPSLPHNLVLRPAGFRRMHPPTISAACLKPGVSKPPVSAEAERAPSRQEGQMAVPHTMERAQQMPPRKLCPIQPAPPKPSSLELQLLTLPSGGVLNVLDVSRRPAGIVSMPKGGDNLDPSPASGCAGSSPTLVIGLVAPATSSIDSPTLAESVFSRPAVRSAVLVQEPVTCSVGSLHLPCKIPEALQVAPSQSVDSSVTVIPTQHVLHSLTSVTPLTAFSQSNVNPVSAAVALGNKTILPELPATRILGSNALPVSSPAWKLNIDGLTTTGAVYTSKEGFTSPVSVWPNHTTLLGQTDTQDVAVLSVSQARTSCTSVAVPQNCLTLTKPPPDMRTHTVSIILPLSQTEAENSVASHGTVEDQLTNQGNTKPPNTLDCSVEPVLLSTGSHSSDPSLHSNTDAPKNACEAVDEERSNSGGPLLPLTESSMTPSSSLHSYSNTQQKMADMEEGAGKENKVVTSGPRRVRGKGSESSTGEGVPKREGRAKARRGIPALSFSKWRTKYRTMEYFGGRGQKMKGRRQFKQCKEHESGRHLQSVPGKEKVHLQREDKEEALTSVSERSLLSFPELKVLTRKEENHSPAVPLPLAPSISTSAGGREEEQRTDQDAKNCAQTVSVGVSDVPGVSVLPLLEDGHREHGECLEDALCDLPGPVIKPAICAGNSSLTPSGERVVLWTREADRVILNACQKQGANKKTFQAVSAQLGNKTASEVAQRFRDLLSLFHRTAQSVQTSTPR